MGALRNRALLQLQRGVINPRRDLNGLQSGSDGKIVRFQFEPTINHEAYATTFGLIFSSVSI